MFSISTQVRLFALPVLVFCSFGLFAQTDLEQGNQAFFQNKRQEAKEKFQKSTLNAEQKPEAHLMLSILAGMEGKDDLSYQEFEKFFNASSNPYPYLYAFWNTESVYGAGAKKPEGQRIFFEKITQDPKAHGTLKAMAWSVLANHYNSSNQHSKGKEMYAKIGDINKWALAGEFENISESGFDKAYEPITNPFDTAIFINKNGSSTKWIVPSGNRNDRWYDVKYSYFADDAIIYAQSFVNSPADQEVVFRVGTSGSIKVWINDALALVEAEERNNGMDTYAAKVKLNKGYNRILLQIGSSELNQCNFMVRLTDDAGNPVAGITAETGYKPYSKASFPLPARIPIFAEEFFEKRIDGGKGSVLDYISLATAYLRNDKGYEARKALKKAAELQPTCAYIKLQQIQAYNRSENETDAKITVEWLKENDPDNLVSLRLKFGEEVDKETYEEAHKVVDKIANLYGLEDEIYLKRIRLAALEKKQDKLISLVEEAYKKFPELYSFVDLKVDVENSINKNNAKAISILRKYLKNNYSNDAMGDLSTLYFGGNNPMQGVETYKEMIGHAPYSPGYHYNLAKFYHGSRLYDLAEAEYNTCLQIGSEVYYFWSALAANYNEKGNTAKAIECYNKALGLNPGDFDSREQLRKLQKKAEIFSYFPKVDVYEIVKKAPAPSAYPDDHSLILLDEVQKVVYAGGTSEEKRIFVVKIMNAEGINRWKQYYLQHYRMQSYNLEKAEVIKANGSKVEGSSDGAQIVFTNLEVGDAVHVTYKVKSSNGGRLARHFWESFYFTHYMPYLTTRYALLVEDGMNFKHLFSKEDIQATIEKKDEFKLYTWQQFNHPGIEFEDKIPEIADVANNLFLSSIPDWTFVSNWYYDLATSKSKVNLEVKEAVAKIFEGKTGLSEMQKARMIYEYIVSNIKYLSVSFLQSGLIPQKASHTLNTRLGDCKDVSTLFVAMCKEAGLSAELVLIATRDNGKKQMLLPSIDFNHCIAKLNSGGKEYYIELTSDKLPFNTFYDNLKNANYLHIKSEQGGQKVELAYLNPPTRNLNQVLRKTEMRLEETDVFVKKTTQKTGVFASNMRDGYRDLGQQDQFKEMQRAIAGDFNQTTLKTLKFKGLQGIGDTLEYTYEFHGPEALTEIGGMSVISVPWSERSRSSDYNFTEDRKFQMDLWNDEGDGEEETVEFTLPAGMMLAEVPQEVNLSCPVAQYTQTAKYAGNKLTLKRQLKYKKDEISLADMKEFETFYRKVVAADSRQIAMKKGTPPPAPAPAAAKPKPAAPAKKK
jgi:tetratricopeptide (TPR) repeat protein